MLTPVDVSILDAKHLTLPAARFQRADDAIVHRRPCPFVVPGVHRQACREQGLLLVAVNPAIALRFVANFDVHSETVERRRRKQRWILEASPIDRGS